MLLLSLELNNNSFTLKFKKVLKWEKKKQFFFTKIPKIDWSMKVAIIHDYLNQYGGAEKVIEVFSELFPDAR